jgi:hypothetical protein
VQNVHWFQIASRTFRTKRNAWHRLRSVERGLRGPAAFAFVQRDETPAMHIELFLRRDAPLVEAAGAQRFTLGFLRRRRAFELDDISHASILLRTGCPN